MRWVRVLLLAQFHGEPESARVTVLLHTVDVKTESVLRDPMLMMMDRTIMTLPRSFGGVAPLEEVAALARSG